MTWLARILRRPYPKSPLLEQAMRVPEPAPEPKGVWVAPDDIPVPMVGASSGGSSGPSFYATFGEDGTVSVEPMLPVTTSITVGIGGSVGPLPTSEFLRRVAHPDKRDRLIEWMEAAANGTVQRDGKGRFVKRKPGGTL